MDKDCRIASGAYDAGFKTDRTAATMIAHNKDGFETQQGVSLAKMLFFESGDVAKTYDKKTGKVKP